MKLLTIFVLIFLVFGGFLVVKYNNYKLDNPDDAVSFGKDYGVWLFGIGKNVVKVTGAVVKTAADSDWLPDNDSNASNETDSEQEVIVTKTNSYPKNVVKEAIVIYE